MVKVTGWTPTSQGYDLDSSSLNRFISPFEASPDGAHDYPLVRSGHRCFTDNDYFYVIGGYTTEFHEGAIFRELWAMSLTTFEWRRYEVEGSLPDTLASFAIVQLAPFSKSFLLFGGSGTLFGTSSSNNLHLVHINNDDCVVVARQLNPTGTAPRPMYGHAMCAGEVSGKYYIIGGTEGSIFNFNVYSLTIRTESSDDASPMEEEDNKENFTWNYELVTENPGFAGRYRLEATYDEISQSLICFGGGNTEEIFGFEQIVTVNVNTKETCEVRTVPDPENGFPKNRRCHTIVRHKRRVIMSGGIGTGNAPNEVPIHSDVWIFNLDDFSWQKCAHSLPESVFFHDSVITEDGWMLSFGGVHGLAADSQRNNVLCGAWFDVPVLQRFALESLRKAYPKMFAGLYCGNFRMSQALEIATTFLKRGKVEEKEKQIIEGKKMKFRENEHRERFYLNEDGVQYVTKHTRPIDEMEIRRREERLAEIQEHHRDLRRLADNANFRELAVQRGFRRALVEVFRQVNARLGVNYQERDWEDESDSGESVQEEIGEIVDELIDDTDDEVAEDQMED